jgi:hypothetical protein
MNAGNQLEREIRELKLLVKGLSKVKDFPQELFELMDNHIDTISLLTGGTSYMAGHGQLADDYINNQPEGEIINIFEVEESRPNISSEIFSTDDSGKIKSKFTSINNPDNHIVSLNETKSVQPVLNDTIDTKRIVDLNRMLTLNDRFRFQREFFGNDSSKMNECLNILNAKETRDEAVEYFKEAYPECEKSDAYDEFIEMLGRMFIKKRS